MPERMEPISGDIYTIAGNGTGGFSGDDALAITAELGSANGIAEDITGNIYIADGGNRRIRKINTSGIISTIACNGYFTSYRGGFSGDGGPAIESELNAPGGIIFDRYGNILIADYNTTASGWFISNYRSVKS